MFFNVTTHVNNPLSLTSAGENGNVPDSYISDDQRLQRLIQFRIATWIDYIYVPLCAGLGILGNLLSLRVLLSPRMAGSSTSVYLASLSVSDSIVQVVNVLFLARKFPGHEVLRHGTCGLVYFLLYFSVHMSVIVTMGMTSERYLAIRFPLKVGQWSTPRRARMVVGVMCIFAFLINTHHLIVMKMKWNDVLKMEVCVPDSSQSEFFVFMVWPWVNGVIYCYLPFIGLAVLNVLIVLQMRSSDKFRGSSGSADQADASRQVTVMLLLVTCAFLVFVGPMVVISVVERYFWVRTSLHEQAVFHLTRVIINNLCFTNHAINFCLYCLSGNRFRQEFLRLFCSCSSDSSMANKGGKHHDTSFKNDHSTLSSFENRAIEKIKTSNAV